MGLVLDRYFDIAAPRLHARARRQSSRPSAGSSLPSRGGMPLSSLRGSFFGWLRAVRADPARSQPLSFRGLLDTPSPLMPSKPRMPFASPSLQDGAGGDALTYPLSHVRVLTRNELSGDLPSGGGPSSWPRSAAAEASNARSRRTH